MIDWHFSKTRLSMSAEQLPVCLITGVGPGTGASLARVFSQGYRVAALARDRDRLNQLAAKHSGVHPYVCDVADSTALMQTLARVRDELAAPRLVIHNAVGGAWGDFMDVDASTLQRNFEVNVLALLQLAQSCLPAMRESGGGVLIATGNTSAYRGKEKFAGFAPTKAAQRILLESIARSAGPDGVHAAYVAIDAVIDLAWTRKQFPDKPDGFFGKPDDIAQEVWRIAHQPRSAWSFDSIIRPYGEAW
jgi:NAD(P)-dependent dehydrogenase (short-subunit alcohol dehydrogenase family)